MFAGLWNEHADALWCVLRGAFGSDGEALGWMTSFRVELEEQVASFDPALPLNRQIAEALRQHVSVGLGRVGPTEGPLVSEPPGRRLDLLLAAFLDFDGVELSPAESEQLTRAYRRPAPAFGRIAAIEAGAPARSDGPRWVALGVLLASLLLVPIGWRLWRLSTGDLPPSETRQVRGVPVADPLLAARVLLDQHVPWLIAEVPDGGACGLQLREVAVEDHRDPMVVFIYQDAAALPWRLARLRSSEEPFPPRDLAGRAVVEWREDITLWSLEGRGGLEEASRLRTCLGSAPRWRAGP